MSNSASDRVDVLIVGAGPAGLVCANALAKAGVSVRIVDQRQTRITAGHADGLMPRTMEILQSYGLAEPLLKVSAQVHSVAFYHHKDDKGIECTDHKPPVMEASARYQFLTTLSQAGIEGIITDSMLQEGLSVQRPARPSSVTISSDESELNDSQAYPVKVVISLLDSENNESGTETVYAKYLVGADGAHSWVRNAVGIVMEGEQTGHVWGAIDFVPSPESNFPDWRNVCTINSKEGSFIMIPREKDMVRLYIDLGSEESLIDKTTGRLNVGSFVADRLMEITRKAFLPYVFTTTSDKIDWWTVYVVGQRVANKLSIKDRVFIAGDACHTHSPKAGQGMNVSMSDAHNLAWKLVYAIRGWGNLSLVKTYEFERLKFAQELIAFDKWYSQGFSAEARAELFGVSGGTPVSPFQAFLEMSSLTSGIGIQYSPSVITLTQPPSESAVSTLILGKRLPPHVVLRAADRLPVEIQDLCPADTRFKILVFTGDLLDSEQAQRVAQFTKELVGPSGVLNSFYDGIFDVLSIVKGSKETVNYLDVPEGLRANWDKVLVDDSHAPGAATGKIYETYGVGAAGGVVVVRPDGYVGALLPLGEIGKNLGEYLSGFLNYVE